MTVCNFCEPWYDSKPLVETPKLIIRLVVKDDMHRYVQLLRKGLFGVLLHFVVSTAMEMAVGV